MKEVINIFNALTEEERQKYIDDMSRYQRELFYELEKDTEKASEYSLSDLLFDFDKEFVERILELEIEEYLKGNTEDNRKNGYTKDIELIVGDKKILFNRPRLRKEKGFNSEFIPKRTRILKDITDNVITLYTRNNSVNDIKEILNEMFGIDISTATISKMTQAIKEEVMMWRNKEIKKCYFTINIDCTYITIRDRKNLVSHKIPIYVAIGTNLEGYKEIVGMYLGNEDENKNVIDEMYDQDIGESSVFWTTVFNDLKDRGLEEVLYIVSDGLCGIENAIKQEFPRARYQRCIVHIVRNLKTYISEKDSKEIIKDFKEIYSSPDKKTSEERYLEFLEKYKDKKTIVKKVMQYYEYIKPLFDVPENIRKYIYTNNIVESANSKIKRGFYGRGALPTIDSAINIIYVNLKGLEEKWGKTKVRNWDKIFSELNTVYSPIIKKYLISKNNN